MLQSIEKKRKKGVGEMSVTVMFHDRNPNFATFEPILALPCRESSLSDRLTGDFAQSSRPASLSAPLTGRAEILEQRRRLIISSLSPFEKFSAEAPMARSAAPVFGADLNASGSEVALKINIQNTEQRCCYAA